MPFRRNPAPILTTTTLMMMKITFTDRGLSVSDANAVPLLKTLPLNLKSRNLGLLSKNAKKNVAAQLMLRNGREFTMRNYYNIFTFL